jgi:outer membrane protein assembly factor BamB
VNELETLDRITAVKSDASGFSRIAVGWYHNLYFHDSKRGIFWEFPSTGSIFRTALSGDGSLIALGLEQYGLIVLEPKRWFATLDEANRKVGTAMGSERSGDHKGAAGIFKSLRIQSEASRLDGALSSGAPIGVVPGAVAPASGLALIEKKDEKCPICFGVLAGSGASVACPNCGNPSDDRAPGWGPVEVLKTEYPVRWICRSPDGSYAAIATLELHMISGKLLLFGGDGTDPIGLQGGWGGLDISSDGNRILTGDMGSVILMDKGGRIIWEYYFGDTIYGMALAKNLSLAAIMLNGELGLLDMSGNLLRKNKIMGEGGLGKRFILSSDGKLFLPIYKTGYGFDYVRGYDDKGMVLWYLNIPNGIIGDIGIDKSDSMIVVGTDNKQFVALDTAGKLAWKKKLNGAINSVGMDPTGAFMIAGAKDGTVYCYDRAGKFRWKYMTGSAIASLVITADGRYIVAGTENKQIIVLSIWGKTVFSQPTPIVPELLIVLGNGTIVFARNWEKDVYYSRLKIPAN